MVFFVAQLFSGFWLERLLSAHKSCVISTSTSEDSLIYGENKQEDQAKVENTGTRKVFETGR